MIESETSKTDVINAQKFLKKKFFEILISPCDNPCSLRDKSYVYEIDKKPVLANAPDVYEDYIEVRGVFDE